MCTFNQQVEERYSPKNPYHDQYNTTFKKNQSDDALQKHYAFQWNEESHLETAPVSFTKAKVVKTCKRQQADKTGGSIPSIIFTPFWRNHDTEELSLGVTIAITKEGKPTKGIG